MALETELKLRIPPHAMSVVRRHALLRGSGRPALLRLNATYYDTPDLALRASGTALRVRREGGRWIQTVKSAGSVSAGVHRREEAAAELPQAHPDLSRIDDPELQAFFARLDGAALGPVFTTVFTRSQRLVHFGGALVEASVDRGEVRHGERSRPFCELELELKHGPPAALFELALKLIEDVPLALERSSKAAQGYALCGAADLPPPVKAKRIVLPVHASVGDAFAAIVAEALAHLEANDAGAELGEDPEYLHQVRVAVRRLRSALSVFEAALPAGSTMPLALELRWLAGELGPARDWDVFVTELVLPASRRAEGVPGWARLHARAAGLRAEALARAQGALTSPRYARLVLTLGALAAGAAWQHPAGEAERAQLDALVHHAAVRELERCHARAARRARKVKNGSPQALHRLRIAVKKLRYAVEFFGSLFDARLADRFRKRLTRLQDVLGRLNDAASAQQLLAGPLSGDDAETAQARGVLLGWCAGESESLRREVRAAWKAFEHAEPFWER